MPAANLIYLKGDVLFHVAEELWLLCCSEITLSTFELLTYGGVKKIQIHEKLLFHVLFMLVKHPSL